MNLFSVSQSKILLVPKRYCINLPLISCVYEGAKLISTEGQSIFHFLRLQQGYIFSDAVFICKEIEKVTYRLRVISPPYIAEVNNSDSANHI